LPFLGEYKIVLEFHEAVDPFKSAILPIKVYSRVMGKIIKSLASHYVVHSRADLDLITSIYGIRKEKVSIVSHGIYDHYEKN